MKNRNIQFKPTAGVLIPLLLACLAAVFISAPTPAAAREMVPFNGTLSGYVETSEFLPPCTIHGHAIVFGNATHLGAYTGTGELYQDVCNRYITLAAFTGLRPTATKSTALSRGT